MITLFVHTRHLQTNIKIPARLTCEELFAAVEEVLGHEMQHRLYLYDAETRETVVVWRHDGEIQATDNTSAYPEQKLILWIYEQANQKPKVWHLWQDDMVLLLEESSMGVEFPDGVAYDKNGFVFNSQHEWSPGSITQLYTLPPEKRPPVDDHYQAYPAPSVCWCDLTKADIFTCPTAWH